jgi:hypothetical protein
MNGTFILSPQQTQSIKLPIQGSDQFLFLADNPSLIAASSVPIGDKYGIVSLRMTLSSLLLYFFLSWPPLRQRPAGRYLGGPSQMPADGGVRDV